MPGLHESYTIGSQLPRIFQYQDIREYTRVPYDNPRGPLNLAIFALVEIRNHKRKRVVDPSCRCHPHRSRQREMLRVMSHCWRKKGACVRWGALFSNHPIGHSLPRGHLDLSIFCHSASFSFLVVLTPLGPQGELLFFHKKSQTVQ